MAISFRAATRDHLSELLSMMKELQSDDPWSCRFDEVLASRALGDLLRNPALGRAWLIADDGMSIGYIVMAFDYSLEYRGRGAWVDEFFVRSTHRGRGIGAQTLDFFVEQARQLGATVVHLEVNHGNPAIELYRKDRRSCDAAKRR
jgi:GNAT superfamily N-acetyltransferase